jgi:hypothetical protein
MKTQSDRRDIAKKTVYFGLATAAALVALCAVSTMDALAAAPLVIKEQGARPFAGTQIGDPAKASISCDHGYVEWQIPQRPRKLPILMVHASSTKTWDTTTAGKVSATSSCAAALRST